MHKLNTARKIMAKLAQPSIKYKTALMAKMNGVHMIAQLERMVCIAR